jgi:hypothetical protein
MLVGGTSRIFHGDDSIGEAIAAVREMVRGVETTQ